MLLSLTTTHPPATDLGFLLHKHPGKVQTFDLPFGAAHVFYPEAADERCTACLLLDVDPVGLVRDRRGPAGDAGLLGQYVNDRPYVASSFLSVAVARVYGSALAGTCKTRPELAETPIPLTARVAVVPCRRGGEVFLRKLFEPLGYAVTATRHPLDEEHPEWGEGPYFTVEIAGRVRLADLLSHLYVLVPVLDDEKHYWVGDDEVDKLLRHGEGWLAAHPEREQITGRYLKRRGSLVRSALAKLAEDEADEEFSSGRAGGVSPLMGEDIRGLTPPARPEPNLHARRLAAVLEVLKATGAKRVLDLGCGEGKLLRLLAAEGQFAEVVGVDVSSRSLEIAADRLDKLRLTPADRDRVKLLHGSLTYRDARLEGFDVAAASEVVEHLDPPRLGAFERAVFGAARPGAVVLTTPNREYNVRFPDLPAGRLRHADHRFEWTRSEFAAWCDGVCRRFGYAVRVEPLGDVDPEVGPPSQMAVFTRGGPGGRGGRFSTSPLAGEVAAERSDAAGGG
ncbi:MAG: 3' terminal RNA ribose 2'-O-methyltransferase Hen1 [Gemmataceae bacterium]|nr:3' terminal RNA ribose 2'-O-methyltransferase Hen1 [Gemmataceae bacterium]